ncbi:hypothetical protein JTE90_011382 [Oedothorax gibbosus]|uniref:Uncharacterized protein n=1 Tax=Oedothorax gibbosus TaxID=931172 RepID=A0AAV6VMT5_9ARAC|nr:hypothetical protein JTE90_011382 [Oedothorax gibbosus]
MALVGKCCFIFNLKDSSILIGFLSTVVSLAGLMTAMLHVLRVLRLPDDPLCVWILQIIYFLGLGGVAFQAVTLLVSVLLLWGALKDVPPLLIPWLGWCPFIIILMIVNVGLALGKDSKYVAELICFVILIFIFLLYASVIITSDFQLLCRAEIQKMSENQCPDGPPRFGSGLPMSSMGASSSEPREQRPSLDRATMREILSSSYAKLLMATEPKQQKPQPV